MKKTTITAIMSLLVIILGSPNARAEEINAQQDYQFTQSGQNYTLHAGESAEKNSGSVSIKNVNGQVILETLPDERQKFYAYKDDYDERVAGGFLMLKAGHSYTFEPRNPRQIEVRQISTNELLGYTWLNPNDGTNSTLLSWKADDYIDSNRDTIISLVEMNTAFDKVEQEVSAAGLPTDITSQNNEKISSSRKLVDKGLIADAYGNIHKIKNDLPVQFAAAKQQAADQAEMESEERVQKVKLGVGAGAAIVLVVGMVSVFVLKRRSGHI